jgi:hypothetical protein
MSNEHLLNLCGGNDCACGDYGAGDGYSAGDVVAHVIIVVQQMMTVQIGMMAMLMDDDDGAGDGVREPGGVEEGRQEDHHRCHGS